MANFALKAHGCCFLSHTTNTHTSFLNVKPQNLHLFPSKRSLKFRVVCSVKEKENVEKSERVSDVITGLQVDGLEQRSSTTDPGLQSGNAGGSREVGFDLNCPPWNNIPQRYKLIGTTSLAFVICNWTRGIYYVQLQEQPLTIIFLDGYSSRVARANRKAYLCSRTKSKEIELCKFDVCNYSNVSPVWVERICGWAGAIILLLGICIESITRRSIPLEERSRAVAFVFGGLSVGSVTGLLLAPPLIQNFGWESVFYIFGFLGLAWFLIFQFLKEEQASYASVPSSRPQSINLDKSWNTSLAELGGSLKEIPWNAFFQSKAVWAMIYAHFCGSWGHYTCLSWLPSYFSEELNLNLTEAAWVSILPPLASIFVTSIAAQLADNLIANGVETTTVRKICQAVAFLSPAVCMTLSSVDLGLPPWEIVGILTGGLALSSFALSGLYCTHQDISPEYASILLGITNTVGAIPGIVGVALTGYLLDTTHSWSMSLFAPSIFFYLTGTIVWLVFASSKPQNFSNRD
ncbi:hypothetical protein GH714_012014 [Hevea brasiliensis]|uniref:Major facilitator superfamily (MFS) profile domain-containing protein n=1 Tax=Hevea brasiliensis TaxID=3981 RepID=A0A6A6MXM9_HEVBR|nr:hypothetical protein GH714_012014 [Hevea brasiliensis]